MWTAFGESGRRCVRGRRRYGCFRSHTRGVEGLGAPARAPTLARGAAGRGGAGRGAWAGRRRLLPRRAGGRRRAAGGLAVPRRGGPAWIAQSRGAGPRNGGGGRMNSIKNVPARVLSRRPGHSLEAEREQFDKTQASGGAAGGRRRLPFPSHASLGARPAPTSRAPGARAAPRTPCSPATWGSPASSRPRPPGSLAFAARAAPRAGEPEARAGARARGGGGPGWPGTGMQPGTEMRPGDQMARRPRCPGTERRPGTEVTRSRGGGRGPGGGSRDAAGGQVGSRCVPGPGAAGRGGPTGFLRPGRAASPGLRPLFPRLKRMPPPRRSNAFP